MSTTKHWFLKDFNQNIVNYTYIKNTGIITKYIIINLKVYIFCAKCNMKKNIRFKETLLNYYKTKNLIVYRIALTVFNIEN